MKYLLDSTKITSQKVRSDQTVVQFEHYFLPPPRTTSKRIYSLSTQVPSTTNNTRLTIQVEQINKLIFIISLAYQQFRSRVALSFRSK